MAEHGQESCGINVWPRCRMEQVEATGVTGRPDLTEIKWWKVGKKTLDYLRLAGSRVGLMLGTALCGPVLVVPRCRPVNLEFGRAPLESVWAGCWL